VGTRNSEYKRKMIRNIRSTPGWLGGGHLDDAAADGPDIT